MAEQPYWERHLHYNNKEDLSLIRNSYPKERTLTIDVSKILDNAVWDQTLTLPGGQEEEILDALRNILPRTDDNYRKILIRWVNVTKKKRIKELRSQDEKRLLSIKALVKRVSEVRPKIVTATFSCPVGHMQQVNPKYEIIIPPKRCHIDGCDFRTFDHLDGRDIKVDRQWLYIQDPLEDLTEGGQPSFLKCEMVEDLCGKIVAGDRVIVNGVYRSVPIHKNGVLTTGKDVFFDVKGLEISEREFDEVKLTDQEIDELTALSKTEGFKDRFIESIAPSILGMKLLKSAIAMQLFEGVTRKLKDGTTNRGHINVLAVTDPGMAKTKLLRFVASVAPRGVFTTATTSTKVGLIAPIVRDETTGEYTIQAGAYMIASGGILCIDEVSELDKSEFKYLNEAMEDGEAHITKGGLNITVKTRASQLAACNPTDGSFDIYRPFATQVKIPESTLSRYDLKILLSDISSEDSDRKMIEHITKTHMEDTVMDGYFDPATLRKYIALGRKLKPKLTKESKKVIDDYYVALRKETSTGDTMKITPRQGTACMRLAEAHARLRLSEKVEVEDAEAATQLFDLCFRNVATDPITGKVDLSRTDHKPSRDSIVSALFRTIKECGSGNGCQIDAILKGMHKYDSEKVQKLIRDLKNEGKLYEPKDGLVRIMQ
jgi:replicative DNA helicase Mcm